MPHMELPRSTKKYNKGLKNSKDSPKKEMQSKDGNRYHPTGQVTGAIYISLMCI
jgi:hypothetical protein